MAKASTGLRLFRQGAFYMVGTLLMRAGNFLLLPIYTALLSTEEYGAIGLLKQVAQILVILSLAGQGPALLKLGILDKPDAERQAKLTGSLVTYVGIAGLFISGGVALMWPLLQSHLDDIPLWPLGLLGLSWVASMAMFQLSLSSLQQRELAREHTTLNLQRWGLLLLGVGVFVLGLRWGAEGLLLAIGISFFGGAVLAFRKLPAGTRPGIDWAILKQSLSYGLPVVPHALSGALLQSADRVILAAGPGLADVGRYTLAANLASIVLVVSAGLQRAWTPFFFRQVRDKQEAGWDDVRRLSLFSVAAVGGVALCVAFGAPILVQLAATPDYISAVPVVGVLALSTFVNAFYLVAAAVIFSKTSAVRYIALATVPPALINVGLNLMFVPRWGMMGAAYATLCSSALMVIFAWILARRAREVPFKFGKGLGVMALVTGLLWVGLDANLLVQACLLLAYVVGLLLLDYRDITGAARSVGRQLRERIRGHDGSE
jgi:O-antigen/teichoic acid export membrane protein